MQTTNQKNYLFPLSQSLYWCPSADQKARGLGVRDWFLPDSILGQRLLFQRQHGCVVQMDMYRDRIITCMKIPQHKLKSEVSRKG